jgi:hypothetical protein
MNYSVSILFVHTSPERATESAQQSKRGHVFGHGHHGGAQEMQIKPGSISFVILSHKQK